MDIWIDGNYEIVNSEYTVILVNGFPAYFLHEGKYYPTVILLLNVKHEKNYVIVDMGAVKHILNGANVFAAGIVNADPDIKIGEAVYVCDVKYKKPLAVGIAMMPGNLMPRERDGVAVTNLHYYGDKIATYS